MAHALRDDQRLMNTLMVIAANVRQRRRALSISQEQFAERCGLHRTYVGAIERAERNITVRALDRLAATLACSVADLVTPQ